MDLMRVKEILSSDKEIPVHYHGVPVWIENIEETSSMAMISARGTHDERRLVSIDGLVENENEDPM
ncbi:H-type small acid-soluble spore protein [Mesobacillus foraminis]|uniref:Small, acid-soluble spore protein H n=1 Tax=Mesobacillus foraminis TaxID=279826 RepID=A0A4R2BMI4_9BACI|nr:H-type small acid-soluble spore protein [Mesobacillus foraminis]MBT2755320.1 H-type small acid-soluble spore protein [Mesobacillus foraminis]TCN27244.1 small acid-soluble spore protein H (minor) [Mesobacillus foraminis]